MKATKDRIIEVAINHIKNIDQINHLTMASLAQDANIGKSTIYEYFKSKAEVIEKAVRGIVDYYTNGFLELELTTFQDSFYRHILYLLEAIEECRNFMMVINKEVKSINIIGDAEQLICKSQEIYVERMMKIFHLGFSENKLKERITSDDYLIMGLLNGVFGLYGSKQIKSDKATIVRNLYETILKMRG